MSLTVAAPFLALGPGKLGRSHGTEDSAGFVHPALPAHHDIDWMPTLGSETAARVLQLCQDPRTAHRQHDTIRLQHRQEDCTQALERGDRARDDHPESTTVRADSGIRRAAPAHRNLTFQVECGDHLLQKKAASFHRLEQLNPHVGSGQRERNAW